MTNTRIVLRAEVRQTQETLFSVDRMAIMVGANLRLAELLENEFVKIVREAWIPEGGCRDFEAYAAKNSTTRRSEPYEPLSEVHKRLHAGVVVAAAGRFIALLPNESAAEQARVRILEAAALAMPSLRLDVASGPADLKSLDSLHKQAARLPIHPRNAPIAAIDLPYLSADRHTGNGPALIESQTPREGSGYETARLLLTRSNAETSVSRFLEKTEIEVGKQTLWKGVPPNDIGDLCGGEEGAALAAIAVDGNGIGSAFEAWSRSITSPDCLQRTYHEELYWHSLRSAMRGAVASALVSSLKTCEKNLAERRACLPFRVLWLGGDDLFVVIDARIAMDFVRNLCRSFESATEASKICEKQMQRLTLSCGIAISSPSMPFAHIRRLADELVDSAKRLRECGQAYQKLSAVDWHVVKGSTIRPLVEERRRDAFHTDGVHRWIFTQRPLPVVLPASASAASGRPGAVRNPDRPQPAIDAKQIKRPTLETLIEETRGLSTKNGASPQLSAAKRVESLIMKDPILAERTYQELRPDSSLFEPIPGTDALWTRVLDQLEIAETLSSNDQ